MMSYVPWNTWLKFCPYIWMVSIPEPPGPPVAVQCQRKVMGGREKQLPGLKKMLPSFFAVAAYLITASRALPAELSW